MVKPVRKAVFPVAGQGTRFLPATKAMPKEMLTIVDRPLIQYAVDEAREAGIEEFIFVTGRAKSAIEDHFDHSAELERSLEESGKQDALAAISEWVPEPGQISYTRQQKPLGLGHAVWCARYHIHDEPFAVLLADDLILARPVTKMNSSMPASRASSTAYWISGRSTMGSISLGMALVAGRKRAPCPATGNTALRTGLTMELDQ